MLDIAIVGGGLAGLSLAVQLQQASLNYCIFEARERLGGRILSVSPSHALSSMSYRFDLGPSWIWPADQPHIASLLRQFNIGYFEQWQQGISLYMSERDAPPQTYRDENAYGSACRVEGGSIRLIDVLREQLSSGSLQLNHQLLGVSNKGDHVELRFKIKDEERLINARRVVLTIPPRVLANSIKFTPVLDQSFTLLMQNTPTWMAGHAKAIVLYAQSFWRKANYSGNGFAIYQGAVLREIFDVSSSDQKIAALSGFFGMSAATRNQYRNDMEALLLDQLVRMFGHEAANPQEIIFQDWCEEVFTATEDDKVPPKSHPQYGHPWFQLDHWNDKLYFAGTETAQQFGGYLEGALESAVRVARSLKL